MERIENKKYIAECVVMLHEKLERKRKFKHYTSLWDKLIDEAISHKVIQTGTDPKILMWAILGMCNWVNKWNSRGGRLSTSEIGDIFYKVLSLSAFVKGGREKSLGNKLKALKITSAKEE